MFRMTCLIKVDKFKPFSPNSLTWNRSVYNLCDSGTIKIPSVTQIKKGGADDNEIEQSANLFKEGMKVEFYAGYNGDNPLRFKGFISRIDFTIPVVLQLEGYSYQLRNKLDFSKLYVNTTAKKILQDLIVGTDIKLSRNIPDIPFDKARFEKKTGIQVLEWFKDQGLAVYFNFDTLYVGGLLLEPNKTIKLRLGWNTIKDDELRFEKQELAQVRFEVTSSRDKDGKRIKATSGNKDNTTKVIKTLIKDLTTQKDIAKQNQKQFGQGYRGSITTFLVPYADPGMAVSIDDTKHENRKGLYFCPSIEGTFSPSGGRQKISIGYSLGSKLKS